MFRHIELLDLNDYFAGLKKREPRGVYFYRITGHNQKIDEFIRRYYESAQANGVIIEKGLPNPSSSNLEFYAETAGNAFRMNVDFISSSLKKWLPGMADAQRHDVANAMYDALCELQRSGKNENILKNAYAKFMCWLYYKFERIIHALGNENVPKILCEGAVNTYVLSMLNILSAAGCDIVLLQYQGEAEHAAADKDSSKPLELKMPGMAPFPQAFSLKQVRHGLEEKLALERLYGAKPQKSSCTNAWISGKIFEDIRKPPHERGSDQRFFYNCFCRISGVEDRAAYINDLYQLQLEVKNSKRNVVIVNESIALPSNQEIDAIHRKNYANINELLTDLSSNIRCGANQELQLTMKKAFFDLLLEEHKKEGMNLHRLTSKAVYLLCWLKRYQQGLFKNLDMSGIACFFYMGGCRNDNEALFCRLLARLPVDVLICCPDLSRKCCLEDSLLYEKTYGQSLAISKFPEENAGVAAGTTAYYAERDLDTLLYQDSGLYRSQQYRMANTVMLHTMYEEIPILWDQELKYRPNFSTVRDVVNMPVIFSKVCGVKDGNVALYWSSIKSLITKDTVLLTNIPHITQASENPIRPFATSFFKNGRLQKQAIKTHKAYQYGLLREATQDYLLEKIQSLIDQKTIRGTLDRGTEYTILSVALNLDKNVLRLIQRFDFTKKNPKLIYIMTGETALSLEDTIYAAFLSQVGFDVIFFVPTGYRCVERYLNKAIDEHQIGEYLYDLNIPSLDAPSQNISPRRSWRDIIFRRGN